MNYFITSEFELVLGASKLDGLNSHTCAVYGLDSKLNIAYQNPASIKFSDDNSDNNHVSCGTSLGQNIFDLIPDVLAPIYKELFESVMNEKNSSLISRQIEYECSSPELYRRFSMHIYPLGKNGGLLAVHSLIIEEPYHISAFLVDATNIVDKGNYINKHGIVTQCANCRRIKNLSIKGQWDWIPTWIKEPHTPMSHGICRPCKHHYYLHDWDIHSE